MRTVVLIALLAFAAAVDASRVNVFRSLLSDEKETKYCKDYKEHSDCPEYYECKKLEHKFCKSEHVCAKDHYGKDDCKNENVCWDYHCVEAPRYCDPYAEYDECDKEYGHGWECMKLDEKKCKYREECKHVKTDKCKEYGYKDKCHYVQGKCKVYDHKEVCKDESYCVEYKQEKKCVEKKVCKAYEQVHECKPNHKCESYDQYNKCTKYGQDCTYKQGPCKDYEYKKTDCHYHPTDVCIKYDTRKVDCKYENTHCKEYEKVHKCEKIEGDCKTYEYKNECKHVEEVCWEGKCEKKKQSPSPYYSSPSPYDD